MKSTTELPQFLRDLIGSPPAAGSGMHPWLFKTARQLHAHRDDQTIVDLLTAAADGCGRHVPQSEIIAAVRDAEKCAWKPNGTARPVTAPPVPKWPAVNHAKREEVISNRFGVVDLWHASPMICTVDSTPAEYFIDELFPGNPLICCGKSMREFTTAPRESFRGKLADLALIVPSPMSALTGKRKADGRESAHTLENTGPRHYQITEFDSGTADEQARIIRHLRGYAPLAVVVSSGGKSLHAWWDCRDVAETIVAKFFRYAVSLGADPATWTRSQFVRLPQGWREDRARRQDVYFFSPIEERSLPQ